MNLIKTNLLLLVAMTGFVLGTALASGNQPSALEQKQVQARIFKATPAKLHQAIVEYCRNYGGVIANTFSASSEYVCQAMRIPGIPQAASLHYTLSANGTASTMVRVRLALNSSPSWYPPYYESLFTAIGDMLVLNEVGVEIRVFK